MTSTHNLSLRAARIVVAGQMLAGDRWQSALAKASGVSQSLLAMIANGQREPTNEACRKIAAGLKKEARRMVKSSKQIDEMAERMLGDLEE